MAIKPRLESITLAVDLFRMVSVYLSDKGSVAQVIIFILIYFIFLTESYLQISTEVHLLLEDFE